MIEVKGLTKYYGSIAAIRDVTFRVESGEIMGFLGPNAAGKTTTMRILAGFMPATSGSAKVAGFDVAKDPLEVKRRVGYLPENVPLYPEMRVFSFLKYVANVKGAPRHLVLREVQRVVERCGVEGMEGRVIQTLSKGYRQRVGLAQALIGSPPVLILDEPTIGLDPGQVIEIRNLIKGLASDHTVLLSSHILPEIAMVCDRALIIHRGRIVAQDTMESLTEQGRTAFLVELEVTGPKERVREALSRVEEVEEVLEEGPGHYLIQTRSRGAGADPREAVATALSRAGLRLRELRARRRTLEDVFVEAISADEERDLLPSQGSGSEGGGEGADAS